MTRQLAWFFVLAYLLSWLWWLPLYAQRFGLDSLPVFRFHHAIGGLGPLLAAFLVTLVFERGAGVKKLAQRMLRPYSFPYLCLALLSPFALGILAALAASNIDGVPLRLADMFTVKEFPQLNIAQFFIYNLVFFGWGEEVGWRGFALPRLQARANALVSAILLAFFWALWHWPLFFYRPGYVSMGWGSIVGWFLSLVTGSILLSWFFNASRGSILCAAVFHSTIDIAFTSDLAAGKAVNYLGFLVTLWGVLVVLLAKPQNLSGRARQVSRSVSG